MRAITVFWFASVIFWMFCVLFAGAHNIELEAMLGLISVPLAAFALVGLYLIFTSPFFGDADEEEVIQLEVDDFEPLDDEGIPWGNWDVLEII